MRLKPLGLSSSCVLILFSYVSLVSAAGIPTLNIPELISGSDLIIVGRVDSVRQVSSTTMELYGRELPARVMVCEIEVSRPLKGRLPGAVAKIRFELPVTPAGGIGYRGIPSGSYRLVFLRASGAYYNFSNPYYPSFPAVPGVEENATTILDQVVAQLAAVIQTADSPEADKLEALFYAQGLNNIALKTALRSGLQSENKSIQLSVATVLLERNDVSALPVAENALVHPKADLPPYLLQNLSSGIARGIRDERAIPGLGRILLGAPDAYARRGAASALRATGSPLATVSLGQGLKDTDFEVRYLAVIGLAEITGQNEWRPLEEDFREHEQRYLTHWTEWVNSSDRASGGARSSSADVPH
jgi:hypothetical protein